MLLMVQTRDSLKGEIRSLNILPVRWLYEEIEEVIRKDRGARKSVGRGNLYSVLSCFLFLFFFNSYVRSSSLTGRQTERQTDTQSMTSLT